MLLYTANVGNYDQVQVTGQPGFDFLVFSSPIKGLTDVKSARKRKITYNCFDSTIWLDANIKINCDLKGFVDKWLKPDVDMVLMQHGRDCIYDEMMACLDRKKDNKLNMQSLTDFYHRERYPKHAGLAGTGIIIRRHNNNVTLVMHEWWKMVEKYSHRDQLSFNYALWKLRKDPNFKIKLAHIPYSVFKNEFELIPHEKNNKK